ncbi:MAG TPA: hypothetical protein GXZ72_08320 [Methanobacterium sp.]|jgi:hypothetical protein|nr:hypothetical protein [Methanobacterium sp.]
MESEKQNLASEIFNDIQRDYGDVEKFVMEDEDVPVFCIYADDDLLWKIFEDWMDEVSSIEFNAGTNEDHYLRVIP